MARHLRRAADIGLAAVNIEGALISAAQIGVVATTQPDQRAAADYGCPKGTSLREEITRYFRIGQAHWQSYANLGAPSVAQSAAFVKSLLEQAFGYRTLTGPHAHVMDGHRYRITWEAKGGRIPIVVAAPIADGDAFTRARSELGDDAGGTIPRRSTSVLLQEWLNACDDALWGLAFAGDRVRLMRDNASFTRPAYIEADLGSIFGDEMFADFTAIWLLIHSTRFGVEGAPIGDCALERWREAGEKAGATARERLRESVEEALLALGQGFLDANPDMRARLDDSSLPVQVWFEQILRVVYRLIFLAVAEDRDLLHTPDTSPVARDLYGTGYGFGQMRERSARRSSHDHHHDAWEGVKIVFSALERGERVLGLPALAGLFGGGLTPDLDDAKLPNRAFLGAVFRLSWLFEDGQRLRINWRDMATEELGSVYEGLLELVPTREDNGRTFTFAGGEEARGNARKKSGSYYTPDSLVQALLDSTLVPVLDRAEAQGGAEAILKLTVVDPACGSGHFLLGAARRMATRVAQLRDSDAPDYAAAMRDVARNCIHGVDRNPMAVELAKVALWIETVKPGKPLGFLDANLRCGDSLLGVFDLAVLQQGIPDGAFKPMPGDDPDVAANYRDKNKREIKERERVESGLRLSAGRDELSRAFEHAQTRPEDSVEDIEVKRELFDRLEAQGGAAWRLRTACDLWTAAWFIQKTDAPVRGREVVPTSGQLWEHLRGATLYGPLIGGADRSAFDHRFFHWPVEFPDVMANGGFDVVVGNPPWERVELQEQEFFSTTHPEIARAPSTAKRKSLIEELRELHLRDYEAWQDALREAATKVLFVKTSGRFPFGSAGKINTYALFADLFVSVVNTDGCCGLILPNGLVTGYTYRHFLQYLLDTRRLVSFYGFENEDKIFKSVHNETKFGLLTITGGRHQVHQPWFTAHLRQPEQIADPERRYALTIDEIEAINPNTLNLPAFRSAKDAAITAAIHKAAPVLIRQSPGKEPDNTWSISLATLFNTSTDSKLFIDDQVVRSSILSREGAMATLKDGDRIYPLVEGKMLWHFDHRYGTYRGQTPNQANKGVLPHVGVVDHDDPNYRVVPKYWVNERDTIDHLGVHTADDWFIALRDVGPTERTLVGSIVPRTAIGDIPLIFSERCAIDKLVLAAILSTLVLDYAARQKSSRMKMFVIEQLPVIHPDSLLLEPVWAGAQVRRWIADRAFELYVTSDELRCVALDLGFNQLAFRWQPERRVILQAEIDAAVLHLYGLSRIEAIGLLDSFTVLRKYEERDHGEFLTKRLVTEIYDEIAVAGHEGRVYQTRLNPGPADSSCCHSATTSAAAQIEL